MALTDRVRRCDGKFIAGGAGLGGQDFSAHFVLWVCESLKFFFCLK